MRRPSRSRRGAAEPALVCAGTGPVADIEPVEIDMLRGRRSSRYDRYVQADAMRSFRNPPVVEAVIGLEFAALPLGVMGLSKLAQMWETDFPNVQEVPALEPTIPPGQPEQPFAFRVAEGVPPIRLWLTSPDGQYLVQVQRDRLLVNWRWRAGGDEYPGYPALRAIFDRLMSEFVAYLDDKGFSPLVITGVEFTYFNRIDSSSNLGDIYSVFRDPVATVPGEPVAMRFQEIRNLPIDQYRAHGQVSIASEPIHDEKGSALHMTVSTKWFPTGLESHADLGELIDSARMVSRATFVALTTETMHEEWGME